MIELAIAAFVLSLLGVISKWSYVLVFIGSIPEWQGIAVIVIFMVWLYALLGVIFNDGVSTD